MLIRVDHLARVRRLTKALRKQGKTAHADSLDHVLAEVQRHFQEPRRLPEVHPTFQVRVISDYRGNGRRLQWAHEGTVASLEGQPTGHLEYLHFGTFACYPIDPGPLPAAPAQKPTPADAPVREWPFPVSAHQERA